MTNLIHGNPVGSLFRPTLEFYFFLTNFETGLLFVALVVLELALWTRPVSNSQSFPHLCFPQCWD